MVNPLYLIAVAIGVGFLFSLVDKLGRKISISVLLLTLGFFLYVSICYMLHFIAGKEAVLVYTAGFQPPYSINFQMGLFESIFLSLINSVGFLGALYLAGEFQKKSSKSMVLYLMAVTGFNGIVMTQDLFNLFVFIEIASIAVYSLFVFDENVKSLSAGFKYIIAGSISSVFFLIGTIFIYRVSGTLYLPDIIKATGAGEAGLIAIFFLFLAIMIELKPFPANGWALDVYESVHPGISALISGSAMTATFFALFKVITIMGGFWYDVAIFIGLITFAGSNLVGIKQTNARRLLGYSSIAQIGLVITILGLTPVLGDKVWFIGGTILFSHIFAKTGLYWIAGLIRNPDIKEWGVLRRKPVLLVLFGIFVFTLMGFPPFPAFFGKWDLILTLMKGQSFVMAGIILIFSFFEGMYLIRWFGYALKLEESASADFQSTFFQRFPIIISGIALFIGGFFASLYINQGFEFLDYLPIAFILLIGFMDNLPSKVKNTIAIAGVIAYSYVLFPRFQGDTMKTIFLFIFLGGGVITLFGGYYAEGKRRGFHAMALTMFAGLVMLVKAVTLLEFFLGWELMSLGSYFLLIRGKKSMPHGLSYMLFSLGGAYAILYAFGLAFSGSGDLTMVALKNIAIFPALAYSLMLLGFMTKTASIGLHVWLPGAHGEAVADISVMASAILLKAGVFGIIVVLLGMGSDAPYAKIILYALGWMGAISALVGNLTATFQESSKRLLAWSSIGQLGYIVFGLATMSHIGWVAALFYTVAHFLYKGILFSIIGGIALKLGTPYMYKMGGLIKKMPFSFFAVLIAIIALSGVPPLVGFSGKWMFYNTILSEKILFQGAVVMVSGMIAFLYLYRLIDTIFLGQLKDNLRQTGEISIWLLIPVYFLIAAILFFSMFPNQLLVPLGELVQGIFPTDSIQWEGTKAITRYGYFNGTAIMYIVGVLFGIVFLWLLYYVHKVHKVKQFNIVYSGESPDRPETTHYAYNFLASYKRSIGFLAEPYVERFWLWMSDAVHAIADQLRRVYTGDAQTYALHIVIYTIMVYVLINGGL